MIEKIMEYGFTFLAGAVVMKLVDWFKEEWVRKKQREIANIQEQLKNLYSPLHFFVSQNMQYFNLGDRVTQTHTKVSLPLAEDESNRIISVSNAYARLVNDNNAQIRRFLQENWSLVDEDDVKAFVTFLANHAHMNVEVMAPNEGLPSWMPRKLDPIFYMPPGFAEKVDGKWKGKRERLDHLRNSWLR